MDNDMRANARLLGQIKRSSRDGTNTQIDREFSQG